MKMINTEVREVKVEITEVASEIRMVIRNKDSDRIIHSVWFNEEEALGICREIDIMIQEIQHKGRKEFSDDQEKADKEGLL